MEKYLNSHSESVLLLSLMILGMAHYPWNAPSEIFSVPRYHFFKSMVLALQLLHAYHTTPHPLLRLADQTVVSFLITNALMRNRIYLVVVWKVPSLDRLLPYLV